MEKICSAKAADCGEGEDLFVMMAPFVPYPGMVLLVSIPLVTAYRVRALLNVIRALALELSKGESGLQSFPKS